MYHSIRLAIYLLFIVALVVIKKTGQKKEGISDHSNNKIIRPIVLSIAVGIISLFLEAALKWLYNIVIPNIFQNEFLNAILTELGTCLIVSLCTLFFCVIIFRIWRMEKGTGKIWVITILFVVVACIVSVLSAMYAVSIAKEMSPENVHFLDLIRYTQWINICSRIEMVFELLPAVSYSIGIMIQNKKRDVVQEERRREDG